MQVEQQHRQKFWAGHQAAGRSKHKIQAGGWEGLHPGVSNPWASGCLKHDYSEKHHALFPITAKQNSILWRCHKF